MPGGKHLRGVGSKEQRQYEHIKESGEVGKIREAREGSGGSHCDETT